MLHLPEGQYFHMCCIEVSHQETENVLKCGWFYALPPGFPSFLVGYGAKGIVFAPGPAVVPP